MVDSHAVMARRAAVSLIAANDNAKGPARASKNTERLEKAEAGWHGGKRRSTKYAGGANNCSVLFAPPDVPTHPAVNPHGTAR
jgi:hypothetical protein